MEEDAQAYEEMSKPQIETGSRFIGKLGIFQGSNVLDMGCGTGCLTKYIADTVGADGQVVGVDPDAARIKIAKEKYRGLCNLQFYVGSSLSGFPGDSLPYYDFFISTAVFHWVPHDEKEIFLRKAHQCLKPGGRLAMTCIVKIPNVVNDIFASYSLTEECYRKLFHDVGLFTNVVMEKNFHTLRCESLGRFKQWYKASAHQDLDSMNPCDIKEHLKEEGDGSVVCVVPRICITAIKP